MTCKQNLSVPSSLNLLPQEHKSQSDQTQVLFNLHNIKTFVAQFQEFDTVHAVSLDNLLGEIR